MIKLSKHTADEIGKRRILLRYIEATLVFPDRVVPGSDRPGPEAFVQNYPRIRESGAARGLPPRRRRCFRGDGALGQRSKAVIRTSYDPEADVLYVAFGPPDVTSDTSEEVAPGVFVEFDPNGNPIGIEIISVRRRGGKMAPVQAAAK
jgi:uncharacterized protein YuzE